jgi:acetylornithine deacetylase/succinyl-diaminopimelate desuccinylase-like protein
MKKKLAAVLLILLAGSYPEFALAQQREPDWNRAGDEAVRLFAEFLRIDTTNPPGNEVRAAEFLSRVLRREGIEAKTFVSSPGRGNLYARIKGNGSRRPVVLLNHTDVVPSDKEFWSFDPMSGMVRDGYIHGRGALDMKSLGAAQLMTLILLKRAGLALDRDVIFLATADEEAGGHQGAGWLVRNHPELTRDAEFLITEGSNNLMVGDRVLYYGIGTTEKTPCWIRLTARGTSGHGSVPQKESAPSRIIRALARLESYQTELKVTPAVARFFREMSTLQTDAELRRAYADIATAIKDPRLAAIVLSSPSNSALLRNTIQPTVVSVGNKTNVIAPVATAEIDCRLLPGERPEDFVAEIKRVIADPYVEVETILAFGATESPIDTELHRVITEVIKREDRSARFIHGVLAGFTDSHFFREQGIVCYGFSPFLIPSRDFIGVHGNDERIPEKSFRDGVRLLYRVVKELCVSQP